MTAVDSAITVRLTPGEYQFAAMAGHIRQAENVCIGRPDYYNYQGPGYDIMVIGAVGEFVAAKALGLFWAGPGTFGGADVGNSLQVRTTTNHAWGLLMHEPDKDDARYIAVCGRGLNYTVRGWLYGRECKRPEWWGEPKKGNGRPCFIVPPDALRPIDTLELRA